MSPREEKTGQRNTHSFAPENAAQLHSESRWEKDRFDELIELLPFKSDDNVLDLGTGAGALLAPLGREIIVDGLTVGVDVARKMVKTARQHTVSLGNCSVVQMGEDYLPFAANSFDGFLLVFVFHEFAYPQEILAEISRTARPEASVVLLDWVKTPDSPRGPTLKHRIPAETTEKMFADVEFKLTSRKSWTEDIYFRKFKKQF